MVQRRYKQMKINGRCVRLFTDKHLENIGSMFKNLYNDELLTDCTLYCKDGSIKAHKLILAASSPYFRKVFVEHGDEHAIFILHGVQFRLLRDLIDLIYKGAIDVPSEALNSVYDLAEDLEVTGVLVEDPDTRCNGYGRDTRFKGQKRVAVDFTADENESVPAKIVRNTPERRSSSSSCSEKSTPQKKNSESNVALNQVQLPVITAVHTHVEDSCRSTVGETDASKSETVSGEELAVQPADDQSNLSVWARKERKFKCDLCPSSFKRASHLSRHQLVHTGERPFACSQCDKAFSRHDKLKHHIHKAHELGALNDSLPHDSLYTIGHVQILTPEQTMVESEEPLASRDGSPASLPQKKSRGRPRKYPIEQTTVYAERLVPDEQIAKFELSLPQKKSRGRPRKIPIEPLGPDEQIVSNDLTPTIKKGRGRPRKYPIVPPPLIKRPRGRPRLNPIVPQDHPMQSENYDISNMPYGDLEYLTKPLNENNEDMSIHDQGLMEPLVEIKTEPSERPELEPEPPQTSVTFFQTIGLLENTSIAKIGECTISVASNNTSSN